MPKITSVQCMGVQCENWLACQGRWEKAGEVIIESKIERVHECKNYRQAMRFGG